MKSLKETNLYNEVIEELNYSFGTVFIFETFVVSEINEGVCLNWEDHGKVITEDVCYYLNTNGSNLIYIAHRINSYSVIASDWLKFFKSSYTLKGYYIVSENSSGLLNSMIENLFFKVKIKRFSSLDAAVNWTKISVD